MYRSPHWRIFLGKRQRGDGLVEEKERWKKKEWREDRALFIAMETEVIKEQAAEKTISYLSGMEK